MAKSPDHPTMEMVSSHLLFYVLLGLILVGMGIFFFRAGEERNPGFSELFFVESPLISDANLLAFSVQINSREKMQWNYEVNAYVDDRIAGSKTAVLNSNESTQISFSIPLSQNPSRALYVRVSVRRTNVNNDENKPVLEISDWAN